MNSRVMRLGVIVALIIISLPVLTYAQHNSPNFEVDEIFIGSGGELEACSNGFCSQQSAGGTGGNTSSNSYGLESGFGTPGEPSLAVTVSNTLVDLGILSLSGTAAASSTFSVGSYLSDGYVVRIHGQAPTNVSGASTHSLTALNAPNEPIIGAEQFGINLVTNSTPGIGASPVQYPDSGFSYGEPEIGYDQENHFKYIDGDIIAKSEVATGITDYTMSIIANIATSTPGGRYQTVLVVQVIATF